jgi:hypothetical protein
MNMLKQLILFFVLCSIFSCASGAESLVKPIPFAMVEVTGDYQGIYDVKDLPPVILSYFNVARFGADMVNPEAHFNSSRGTQLIAAGNAGEIWFIEYFTGGSGVSRWFIAFRITDNVVHSLTTIYPVDTLPIREISIEELARRLPNKASCVSQKENWVQYMYENGFGLCPNR